jgi:hypothetical protein
MFLFGGLFALLLAIVLCVHVVRTGQPYFWLWIILFLQPIGAIVYLVAIVLPEMMGGRAARTLGRAARETLDPTRDYRAAKAAYDDAPTVANAIRLAQAAMAFGRFDEAEALYREAAQGVHAEDPTLLLGRANALIELRRFDDALGVLNALGQDEARGRTAPAALALGRAYEGLGRNSEAETAYEWAAERLPGLEAICRYAAFLARTGRRAQAQDMLKDIDRRIAKSDPAFRKEARAWRALAAEAIAP